MKHYVMLSQITGSGGVQCYVAAKSKYLETQGWHVVVISGNTPKTKGRCIISSLNRFLPNGNPYQGLHPCFIPKFMVKRALKRYLNVIGPVNKDDEVVVESWNSPTALWGELIASRLHGRHMFWTANEHFRKYGEDIDQCYEEKIDFYMFKMDRGEILTRMETANRLFVGYRVYKEGEVMDSFITEDPIQDVDSPAIDAIIKADWNICYIGRSNKPYVHNIFKDVGVFASKFPEKTVQFIIVGKVEHNRDVLSEISNVGNLKVIELGDLYPLPRSLYSKVDVVIAGSGSARHSMDEGALVITADSWYCNSHGILGYDTNDSVQKEDRADALDMTFEEALVRALVEKKWQSQESKWIKSPGIAECSKRQFEVIAHAAPELKYYDEKLLLEGNTDWRRTFSFIYHKFSFIALNK